MKIISKFEIGEAAFYTSGQGIVKDVICDILICVSTKNIEYTFSTKRIRKNEKDVHKSYQDAEKNLPNNFEDFTENTKQIELPKIQELKEFWEKER